MNKFLLILGGSLIFINSYSQITFEKGYLIDNNNQRISILIKNKDWKYNPTEFEYKYNKNSKIKKANLKSVKEFGIGHNSKYIRSKVKIDISGDQLNNLTTKKEPIFKDKEVFLKILVEGKASLFQYSDPTLTRYFYKLNHSSIKPLIYKIYRITDDYIYKNNQFRKQLWEYMKCPKFNMKQIENINYKKKDLVYFFVNYNKCKNVDPLVLQTKNDRFKINIRPRLNYSSLSIINSKVYAKGIEFRNKLIGGLGIELEYILAFNKNKWSIILEPTYQHYNSKKTVEANNVLGGNIITKVEYNSIELPIGGRYYFYLHPQSKLFFNTSLVFDFNFNSKVEITRVDGSFLRKLDVKPRINLAFGTGFKHNKYSIEIRYLSDREILDNYITWKSSYKSFSVILGYTFL